MEKQAKIKKKGKKREWCWRKEKLYVLNMKKRNLQKNIT